jgi:colicin import membrane protein
VTQNDERAAGGLRGRLAGKTKETAGSLTGNEDLAREGRLQQEAVDAREDAQREAAEARQAARVAELADDRARNDRQREELENELAADGREEQAERDRAAAEAEAAAAARRREREAEAEREQRERIARAGETRAAVGEAEDLQDAAALHREAGRAEARAEELEQEER